MSLLPNESQVNSSSPFWQPGVASGGGGGGSVGPNPSFSTITLSAGVSGSVTDGTINYTDRLTFNNTGPGQNVTFSSPSPGVTAITLGDPTSDVNTAIGASSAGGFITSVNQNTFATMPLDLTQNSQVTINNLLVSSINGAAPGGGGSANPQLSSIVVNGLTTAVTGQGGIAFAFDFPDNSANIPAGSYIGLQQGVVAGTGFGNTNAVLAAVNAGGSAATADFAAQRVIVGQQGTGSSASAKPYLAEADGLINIVPGISTLALNVSSINGAAPGGSEPNPVVSSITAGTAIVSTIQSGAAPMLIDSQGQAMAIAASQFNIPAALTSISSLNVSSINGAAPGGGSSITRTTVPTVDTATILGDGSAVVVTPNFTTLAGHLYTLSGWLYASASANISSNSSLALQIGNIDRAYQPAMPLWGYSPAGAIAFGNNIPVSFTWRATSGAVNNVINAQMVDALGTAVSTVINSSNGLLLVDYGAVA